MRTHGCLVTAFALKTLARGVGWAFALLVMVDSVILGPPPAAAADDPRDSDYLASVLNRVLETERSGVEIPWSNAETGNEGVIVIERTYYRPPEDTPCREYRRTVETPGGPEAVVKGTGCRIESGLWELEEQGEPPSGTPGAPPAAAGGGGGGGGPTPVATGDETKPPEPPAAAPPPSCPAIDPKQVVRVPCSRPPAFTDYTMPTKAKL